MRAAEARGQEEEGPDEWIHMEEEMEREVAEEEAGAGQNGGEVELEEWIQMELELGEEEGIQ